MFRSVLAVAVGLWAISLSSVAVAAPVISKMNLGNLEDQLFIENRQFAGNWQDKTTWKSSFCSGGAFYTYNLNLKAILDDVKLGLQEDGRMKAFARFDTIWGGAKGSLKNGGTFCRELAASLGLGVEWAEITALVSFGETGAIEDLAVQVTDTKIGKLEMGKYFPDWFENMMTGIVNRALHYTWQSRLGTWLNKKITAFAKRNIPEQHL